MKKLIVLFFSLLTIIGCSEEPPSVRVNNQNLGKANVQIKMANSNTININDVEPNKTTAYQEIAEGATIATAVIQNEKDTPTSSFSATKNKNYTIIIQNTVPPTIKIDSSDK